jgi:DNA-binding FadR family transcriptional regulator
LEGAAAELAAGRANNQDVEDLDRLVNTPLPAKELAAMIQANAAFHLRLARIAQNRELVESLTRILEKTEHLVYIELRRSRFRYTELSVMHGRIVDALRVRNPQRLREAVLNDILEAQRATLSFGKNAVDIALDGGQKESNSQPAVAARDPRKGLS